MCRRNFIFIILLFLFTQTMHAQLTYNEVKVEYDSAWIFKNLEVIPIRFKDANSNTKNKAASLLAFDEALQKHKIKLQEMQYEKGADVNWLQVTNHSRQTVLVQAGNIVAGGKQDRMVAETKFIEPGKTDYIHVYCVEKRRWDDKAKDFTAAGVANFELRKAMDLTSRQAEVWKEIDHQYAANKKASETFSFLNIYNDSNGATQPIPTIFCKKYQRDR